jgi:hypothetical protein
MLWRVRGVACGARLCTCDAQQATQHTERSSNLDTRRKDRRGWWRNSDGRAPIRALVTAHHPHALVARGGWARADHRHLKHTHTHMHTRAHTHTHTHTHTTSSSSTPCAANMLPLCTAVPPAAPLTRPATATVCTGRVVACSCTSAHMQSAGMSWSHDQAGPQTTRCTHQASPPIGSPTEECAAAGARLRPPVRG